MKKYKLLKWYPGLLPSWKGKDVLLVITDKGYYTKIGDKTSYAIVDISSVKYEEYWAEENTLFVSAEGDVVTQGDVWYEVEEGKQSIRANTTLDNISTKKVLRFSRLKTAELYIAFKALGIPKEKLTFFC